MLAYLPANSAIITGLAPLSSPTLSQLYLSHRTLSRLWCACLPLLLLVVCLPAFSVVVTVFTLPVKDEAETASLIAVSWREEGENEGCCGVGGRGRKWEVAVTFQTVKSPRWFTQLCVRDKPGSSVCRQAEFPYSCHDAQLEWFYI